MEEKPQYRLKNGSVFAFIAVAAFADLTTLVPFVGDFVGPVFWGLTTVYLWKKGLGLVNGKRLAAEGISFIAELIPGVQEFPTILLASIAIVAMSRIEDKTGIKIPTKGASRARSPANHNGIRLPETQTTTTNNSGGKGHVTTYNAGPLNSNGVRVATTTQSKTSTGTNSSPLENSGVVIRE